MLLDVQFTIGGGIRRCDYCHDAAPRCGEGHTAQAEKQARQIEDSGAGAAVKGEREKSSTILLAAFVHMIVWVLDQNEYAINGVSDEFLKR